MHMEEDDIALIGLDESHYHVICILQHYIMKLGTLPVELRNLVRENHKGA